MVRVEKDIETQQEIKKLRQDFAEVEAVSKKNRGSSKLKWGCLGLVVFLILFFTGVVVWILAAMGLITVPVVSSLAYKEPRPIHDVEAGVPLEVQVTEVFNSILTQRLQSGAGVLSDRSIIIPFPETSLTTSLQHLVKENNIEWIKAEKVQVVADQLLGIEIFVPLVNQDNNNAIRLLVVPRVEQGLVVLDKISVTLGNFTFPTGLTNLLVKPVAEKGLDNLNQLLGRYVLIDEIQVFDGEIKILGNLVVEIMKF